MKKKSVLIILFILLLTLQIKAEEEIFSDYICSGNSTTIGDEVFKVSVGITGDRAVVTMPTDSRLIINNGTCEVQDYYKVCFDNSDLCYHDYERDIEVKKAKITISKIIADVELTRTIEPLTFLVGETSKINVKIQNTGGRKAENIQYIDAFPSFALSYVEGCSIRGNNIVWNGNLNMNQGKKCSFKVKGLTNISFSSKANLSYYNGFETKEISDTADIVVQGSQLEIENAAPAQIETTEEFSFNITLKNINTEENLRVNSFEINIPSKVEVIKKPSEFDKSYNKYSWHGTLQPEESIDFSFKLKSSDAAIHQIRESSGFTIKNMLRNIERVFELNITDPIAGMDFNINKTNLKSGDTASINVNITNPSNIHSLKDIEIEIRTDIKDLAGKTKLLSSLQPKNTINVIKRDFMAPPVNNETSFVVYAISNYKVNNKIITINKSTELIVSPSEIIEETEVVDEIITTNTTPEKEEQKTSIKEKLNATITRGVKEIKEKALSKTTIWIVSIVIVIIILVNIFLFIKKKVGRKIKRTEVFDV